MTVHSVVLSCLSCCHLTVTPVKLGSVALGISAALLISMACTPQEKLNTSKCLQHPSLTLSHVYLHRYLPVPESDCDSLTVIHHLPQYHVTLSCAISAEQIIWKKVIYPLYLLRKYLRPDYDFSPIYGLFCHHEQFFHAVKCGQITEFF